jgi:hypothetical protein
MQQGSVLQASETHRTNLGKFCVTKQTPKRTAARPQILFIVMSSTSLGFYGLSKTILRGPILYPVEKIRLFYGPA